MAQAADQLYTCCQMPQGAHTTRKRARAKDSRPPAAALEEAGEEQGESQHPAPQDQHPEGREGENASLPRISPSRLPRYRPLDGTPSTTPSWGMGRDQQEAFQEAKSQ